MIYQIKIVSITNKTSVKGDDYWVIKAEDGTTYSCWDIAVASLLKEGAVNKVEVIKKGKWNNIIEAISYVPNIIPVPNVVPTGKPNWEEIRREKHDGIDALNARTQAVNITIALYQKGEIDKNSILNTVKNFYEGLRIITSNGNTSPENDHPYDGENVYQPEEY